MCGMKNQGQQGCLKPSESSINFVVPDRKSLEGTEVSDSLKGIDPGILRRMIEMLNDDDEEQTKTFKLCFDGKKLNPGVDGQLKGDVNLWGYEGPPTLKERENQVKETFNIVESLEAVIESLEKRDLTNILHASDAVKDDIVTKSKVAIEKLSRTLSDLRVVKQKKEITLEKLKNACSTEELKSKYAYALSAVKTFIYRLNGCISKILKVTDELGCKICILNDSVGNYCLGQVCDLGDQNNYVCLTGSETPDVNEGDIQCKDTRFIKQRTKTWENTRKHACVTGSTCFNALGFGGLKKQKEHYDYVFHAKEKPKPNSQIQTMMDHGTKNEINAIATICSKILTIMYPSSSYFEEGCEAVFHNEKMMLLVSPDGSLRTISDSACINDPPATFGVEIKCPFPGSVYKPKVHYEMPFYYVPQILCEMAVLNTKRLLYICYSSESTTLLEAEFDSDLWEVIVSDMLRLYNNDDRKCPTKLSPELKNTKEKLREYCKTKVTFKAEVKSVIAKVCCHANESVYTSDVKFNLHGTTASNRLTVCTPADFQTTLYELGETVKESALLSRHMATEVLIYLISDLDRTHTPERQHAVPVGYGLKGYSITTDITRKMMDDILDECYKGGLYVPVVSSDGQWFKIAVRSSNGEPLTLLQLMKDVYKSAKSMKKSDILKSFKEINLVKVESQNEVFDNIDIRVDVSSDGQYCGPIYVWRRKLTPYLLQTSATVKAMLANKSGTGNIEDTNDNDDVQSNDIVNGLPADVVTTIEPDIYETLTAQNTNVPKDGSASCPDMTQVDIAEELIGLFADDDRDTLSVTELVNENMESDVFSDTNVASVSNGTLESNDRQENTEDQEANSTSPSVNSNTVLREILWVLQTDSGVKRKKWAEITFEEISQMTSSRLEIEKAFYRSEIQICLKSLSEILKTAGIYFAISWNKHMLSEFLYKLINEPSCTMTRSNKRPRMFTLKTIALNAISKMPKHILNVIHAEHEYPKAEEEWRTNSTFSNTTEIDGLDSDISWYSKPEYVEKRFTHLFFILDAHHLLTNARTKCCSSGIPEAGIDKKAWINVARTTGVINRALVEDLVDKQSNAFARKTFSVEVEAEMRLMGYQSEANFCRLIREWYEAEDEPGLSVFERCIRRLKLREWLCSNIHIGRFPPPGSHVN